MGNVPGDPNTFRSPDLDADPFAGGKGWSILGAVATADQLAFSGGPLGKTIDTSTQPGGKLFLANVNLPSPPGGGSGFQAVVTLIGNGVEMARPMFITVGPDPGAFPPAGELPYIDPPWQSQPLPAPEPPPVVVPPTIEPPQPEPPPDVGPGRDLPPGIDVGSDPPPPVIDVPPMGEPEPPLEITNLDPRGLIVWHGYELGTVGPDGQLVLRLATFQPTELRPMVYQNAGGDLPATASSGDFVAEDGGLLPMAFTSYAYDGAVNNYGMLTAAQFGADSDDLAEMSAYFGGTSGAPANRSRATATRSSPSRQRSPPSPQPPCALPAVVDAARPADRESHWLPRWPPRGSHSHCGPLRRGPASAVRAAPSKAPHSRSSKSPKNLLKMSHDLC